ncbi:sensor histidine kinase [Lewinella sp. LCG006]|uniref:sensor histidine kinase n=1 Tax=Lewinella sp. LCG006 TaxID=3231911 RepID=UPI00345FC4D6
MNNLLQRYRPLWLGALITLFLVISLRAIGFLLIDPSEMGPNLVIFTFWWLLLAFLLYRFDRVAHKMKLLGHLGIMAFLLIAAIVVGSSSAFDDNPLTITLLIAAALYLFRWLVPNFFRLYQWFIIGSYLVLLTIFAVARFKPAYFEAHSDVLYAAFFWPVPLLLALWVYQQWKWLKSIRAEKAEAELALLKSQINPHFFFNTLNNLYSLTVEQSPKAPEMIVKLSEMMRYTIYEGKKEWVPVLEEVHYLQNYLELQEIRHHHQVNISFYQELEPGVQVSPLLFIVLLENAFKHGAEHLLKDAYIQLQLVAKESQITFSVENNFDPEVLTSSTDGIGLENLRRRLNLVYPGNYTLKTIKTDNTYQAILTIG